MAIDVDDTALEFADEWEFSLPKWANKVQRKDRLIKLFKQWVNTGKIELVPPKEFR